MHPLWLFQGHYHDLREAVGRGAGKFVYRHLAADLRGLLVDATPIGNAANRLFRLTVFFPTLPGAAAPGFAARPGGAALNEYLLAGPPNPSTPPGAQVENVSRDAFLALPAVRLADGSTFSLREVVLAGANLAGGIHSSARGAEGEHLQPLAAALFGPGFGPDLSAGGEFLIAVARHVLKAYEHLFTVTEGTSLGLAQPRNKHQPLFRVDPARDRDGIATEFAGVEFFEDGLSSGLSPPFVWVGLLALRLPDADGTKSPSPITDRHVVDVGSLDSPGPRFSIIQRGRSILARCVTSGGEVVATRPVRLMDRRFYAVAAGLAETEGAGQVRVFVRLRGETHNVEAFGPLSVGMGASLPSRMTVGAGLDRNEVRNGGGALMQLRTMLFGPTASEREINAGLEEVWREVLSRRWVVSPLPEERVSVFYNQARGVSGPDQ